ncbi:MAG: NlpC/P60 family protein [bacterium]|nr:NlpC/P60 family protein [bacterium]
MEQRASAIIATARQFRGTPFKRGVRPEEMPAFLDCSSFAQLVFGLVGIALPRRAYQQAQCGIIVRDEAGLQRGDLLFFEGHIAGRKPVVLEGMEFWIGHVAIYAGEGKIVQCTRRRGVHITKLSVAKRKKLVLMKRIL